MMSSSIAHIRETISKEREELKHMGRRIKEVTQYCDMERSVLKAEVNRTHEILERSETNSHRQNREMKTVTHIQWNPL